MQNKNLPWILSGVIGLMLGFGICSFLRPVPAPLVSPVPPMDHSAHAPMQMQMDDMSASLKGKIGDDFDKAFIDEMIIHHEGAVDMAEQVLATSQRVELIKLAKDIIKAQTSEIEMMRQWRAEWFK